MAGQKFNISFVIGAVDNLTTKVMQINDRVNKATAPLGKAKDAFGLLGAELGVNKFGVALGNLGTKGQKVFDEFLSAGAKIAGLGVAIGGGLAYVVKGASDSADAISDASNRIETSQAAVALGRELFFDPRLSADGRFACATCHVYVAPEWAAKLTPANDAELAMLEFTDGIDSTSRLACQIIASDAINGLTLQMPASQH